METNRDCTGCTDRNSEGTHQMHTKQHTCPPEGDPNCGYCFPQDTQWEERFLEKHVNKFSTPQAAQAVRDFISKTLASERERLATAVEGMKILIGGNFNSVERYANDSWNVAIDDAAALIRNSPNK